MALRPSVLTSAPPLRRRLLPNDGRDYTDTGPAASALLSAMAVQRTAAWSQAASPSGSGTAARPGTGPAPRPATRGTNRTKDRGTSAPPEITSRPLRSPTDCSGSSTDRRLPTARCRQDDVVNESGNQIRRSPASLSRGCHAACVAQSTTRLPTNFESPANCIRPSLTSDTRELF